MAANRGPLLSRRWFLAETGATGAALWIGRGLTANLATADRDTLIVPGHGPVGDRVRLKLYHDMLVKTREQVARLKARGSALEEIVRARPPLPMTTPGAVA
jgi:glyoxylase-like metal-dependent hydrolase (beta-lactamase superfamily II)